MNVTELENRLYELREELRKLNIQINEKQSEIEQYISRRDSLHSEIKKLSEELKKLNQEGAEYRKRIRDLTDQLKERKKILEEIRTQYREIKDELKTLRNVGDNIEEIEERLQRLDWLLQTKPLPKDDEKRISSEVERLQNELILARKKRELRSEKRLEKIKKSFLQKYWSHAQCYERRLRNLKRKRTNGIINT